MPQQAIPSLENNFSKGLITETTGLTFPENAVFDTENCIFNRIGNVTRREGINYEANYTQQTIDRTNKAISNYRWKNAGGDGTTQVLVMQVGTTLRFYQSSASTIASPLSTQLLVSTIDISTYVAVNGTFDSSVECQYTDGNGFLFVFHPNCDPFYCYYTAGTITASKITIKIRDFQGIVEVGVEDTLRSVALSNNHNYNLQNQGWAQDNSKSAFSFSTVTFGLAATNISLTVGTGLGFIAGDQGGILGQDAITGAQVIGSGTVVSYASTTLVLSAQNFSSIFPESVTNINFTVGGTSTKVATFKTATGVNPSNSDVWWRFKNNSGVYDPASTTANVTVNSAPAAKGHFTLQAFNQLRSTPSAIPGLTTVTTTVRPRTGAWFQGRVWYAGVDSAKFTENLYFSQIIDNIDPVLPLKFEKCYQVNDPTSEDFFDLLPSDGGVVVIQGCGSIYKLFPIQNGLLVFAANGVWFITGSQGQGFTATDYTIIKVSAIQSISGTSFVDVRGYPMWWNEEGIYTIKTNENNSPYAFGGLSVEPLTYTTIQTLYQEIPLSSKKYARGEYDPLDWVVKWTYRSTEAPDTTGRYQFDGIIVLNTITQAFYPWTLSTTTGVPYIHGIAYVQSPGGSTAPSPILKYITSVASGPSYSFTFSEENDTTTWTDFTSSGTSYNYTSYFVSGYKLKGQGQRNMQNEYLFVYSNNDGANSAYKLQGLWNYAISALSGKYTNLQRTDIVNMFAQFGVAVKKHRIRGRGYVLQFKIVSVDGSAFDIIGWSVDDRANTGV